MKISRDTNGNKILSIQNTDLDGHQGVLYSNTKEPTKNPQKWHMEKFRQIEAIEHLQIKS